MELYRKNRAQAEDAGLALLPKLKYEHVHLTSFSKMRVDLAAQVQLIHLNTCSCSITPCCPLLCTCIMQVLSQSVSKALQMTVGTRAKETARFADMFDKFFDCLNCSTLSAGKRTRNPFKSPYRSGTDWKLKVNTWSKCVWIYMYVPCLCLYIPV